MNRKDLLTLTTKGINRKKKKGGFRELLKYGHDLEIYLTTWNVGETKPNTENGYYNGKYYTSLSYYQYIFNLLTILILYLYLLSIINHYIC